jgi:hypothetical protein
MHLNLEELGQRSGESMASQNAAGSLDYPAKSCKEEYSIAAQRPVARGSRSM